MKKTIVLLTTLLTLTLGISMAGCSLLGGPIAERVADVVDDYCSEPFAARQLYRDTVNEELAAEGHSIEVRCAGDPDEVTAIGGPATEDLIAAVDVWCVGKSSRFLSGSHDVAVRCRDPGEGGRWKG